MALEFTDFGLSPDEAVKQREQAFASFTDVAQPALAKKQGAERGQLISDMEQNIAKAAMTGNRAAMGATMGAGQQKAAELLPAQAKELDTAAREGAQMGLDILTGRQTQALSKFENMTGEMKSIAADAIAKKAFEQGMAAKELAVSRNGYLADRGLDQMYADLQAGRENTATLRQMQNQLAIRSQQMQQETAEMIKGLENELATEIAQGNYAAAKSRLMAVLEAQKEAARTAAQASQIGAMISGAFTIGGAIVAGPGGAIAAKTVADAAVNAKK